LLNVKRTTTRSFSGIMGGAKAKFGIGIGAGTKVGVRNSLGIGSALGKVSSNSASPT
jgi:hypothetical protein